MAVSDKTPSSRPIRIMLVDDHPVIRTGLALILNNEPDMTVVAQAGSGDEALTMYWQYRPDITLMDLKMSGMTGVQAVQKIRAQAPTARLIILTSYDRDEDIYQSIRAGAMGYLVKDAPSDQIIDALREVHKGRKHFPHTITEKLAERVTMADLSDRELEVLRLLAVGQSNKEIAEKLFLALGTVKYHINNILTKLEAEDRTQAVLAALKRGLVELQ
jgi:two-component system, NarL family, response regulator